MRVDAGGIAAELGFHQTDFFEDFGEIDAGKRPEAAERVGGGDDFRRFAGVLRADYFNQRHAEPLFNPVLGLTESRFFVLQLLGESGNEVGFARDRLGFKVVQGVLKSRIAQTRGVGEAVGPEVSGLAQLLGTGDARCQAGKRLNQRDPEIKRKRPQLGDGQRDGFLKVAERIAYVALVQSVVCFGGELEREAFYAFARG